MRPRHAIFLSLRGKGGRIKRPLSGVFLNSKLFVGEAKWQNP